ncbi:MAG: HAMP domain-containing histidine kinase [Actinomycetota bacterium]|nr:HAMP domain-containing histidine kinase [Actinomycetota bacterium]
MTVQSRTRRLRIRPRSLAGQLALIAAVAVAPVLAGLVVIGLLMVISDHAVLLVSAIVAGAGVLAVAGAWLVSRALVGDLDAIRDGLESVGTGAREIVISTSANDELSQVADAANVMIARLAGEEAARDRSEAARHQLVASVSHDLRTPITSLRLLADAIGDDIVAGEQRRSYVRRMGTHIDALSALIDDLFELSRLEAGDIGWSLERLAVGDLVDEAVDAMRAQAEAKGVRVAIKMAPELSPARGNPEKLQRVLFNLIQNAIRHTPADGSVVVRAQPTPQGIEIEVADTGEGIAAAEREHVFSPFYRGGADAARTGAGAGLGLALSRAIIEAHGGQIWIADSTAGARVRFSLPVAA